jgi:hypothetical protein
MHENAHDRSVGLLPAVGPEAHGRVPSGFQRRKGLIDLRRSIENASNDV